MKLPKTKINKQMSKEQAILYYLFVDDQLTCAWWDYLEEWQDFKELAPEKNSEFQKIQFDKKCTACLLQQTKNECRHPLAQYTLKRLLYK